MPDIPKDVVTDVKLAGDGSLVAIGGKGELGRVKRGTKKQMQAAMDLVMDPMNGQRCFVHILPDGGYITRILTNPYDEKGKLIDMGKWWETGEVDGEALDAVVAFARNLG